MIVQSKGPNLGVRSTNPESITLAKDITIPSVKGMQGGLGFALLSPSTWTDFSTFSLTDPNSASSVGFLGYAVAGGLLYYLLFHSSRAKERRAALKTAKAHYEEERRAVYSKYGRV